MSCTDCSLIPPIYKGSPAIPSLAFGASMQRSDMDIYSPSQSRRNFTDILCVVFTYPGPYVCSSSEIISYAFPV